MFVLQFLYAAKRRKTSKRQKCHVRDMGMIIFIYLSNACLVFFVNFHVFSEEKCTAEASTGTEDKDFRCETTHKETQCDKDHEAIFTLKTGIINIMLHQPKIMLLSSVEFHNCQEFILYVFYVMYMF